MTMQGARDRAAIVGVGSTPYYRRGQSAPQSTLELGCKAILAALADAGIPIDELDGFSYYCGGLDSSLIANWLGVPEVRFTATVTGGGGGASASVGMAAAAITAGLADVVVSVLAVQNVVRLGATFARTTGTYAAPASAERDFFAPAALFAPGHMFALLARRHMHEYGTKREHFGEIAISTRANAMKRDTALQRDPMTMDDYFNARMIADPFGLFDFCLESDGAVAIVTTSAERAQHLRQSPVYIRACSMGGPGSWGGLHTMNVPSEIFATSGHRLVAQRLYERAGLGPDDVDVALIYDHFTGSVLMTIEDYGFCPVGEGGRFVSEGSIRWPSGSIPLNTHGGNLSEAYLMGFTHVREAVEQLRGSAVNQVPGAEVALVTSGPSSVPQSSLVLRR